MGSGAELGSALRSAAGEDLAAVCGLHSLAEAVFLLSVTLFGLIGTNCCHTSYTFLSFDNTQQRPALLWKTAVVDLFGFTKRSLHLLPETQKVKSPEN